MTIGGIKNQVSDLDIFSGFIANIIHDYEHPGYSNQFIVKTKHPLAVRYSDIHVLENHSLAAAFHVIFKTPECNIMQNLTSSMYKDSRKIIIEVVLNSDLCRHFGLLTALKTKLGNDFPSDSIEDRTLILSMCLRTSDIFKVVRDGR